ncbi:MAG: OmpA family protein [Flavobacteriales bacterium]|nr:OmpA family protein [Flavobacteriales bacterium]
MRGVLHITLFLPFLAQGQEILEVLPLEYQPKAEDFAPTLVDSSLVFCSIREQEQTIAYVDEDTGTPLADLYHLDLRSGRALKPQIYSDALITPVHDGPIAIGRSGSMAIVTRNITRPRKLGNLKAPNDQFGLFVAERGSQGWKQPKPFMYNAREWSTMHAAISPDGNTLVFVSDMPGGYGGFDLYITEWEDGEWMLPVNMGPVVNSSGHELFPSFHASGALHFSSDRLGGAGKLDILRTLPVGTKWTEPKHLPAPINSTGNDICYTSWAHDRQGFLSSDRSGTDQIYRFRRTIEPFLNCAQQRRNNFCFRFEDEANTPKLKLPLRYQWDLGDGTVIQGEKAEHCYSGPGRYIVSLDLVDTLTGKRFYRASSFELDVALVEQAFILSPDTIRRGRPVRFDGAQSHLPRMQTIEYRWNMGDGTWKDGTQIEHVFRAAGTYEIMLDVIGLPLPDGRIPHHCVTKPLVVIERAPNAPAETVEPDFVEAASVWREFEYQELSGDELRMLETENGDVLFTVELFASRERVSLDDPVFAAIRKQYTVVERFDPKRGMYTYSVGEASDPVALYEVFQKVLELRFLDAEVMTLAEEQVVDLSRIMNIDINLLNSTLVRSSSVLFPSNSSNINKNFHVALERIGALLERYPHVQVVIEAHTDDRGSNSLNMRLSQSRADAAREWFIQQGISQGRVVAIGFGEDRPVATNATEDGRALNRRADFRLTTDMPVQAGMP